MLRQILYNDLSLVYISLKRPHPDHLCEISLAQKIFQSSPRAPFLPEFLVNLVSRDTFHFKSFQSTKRRSDSQTNTPWNFILRPTTQRRIVSACANRVALVREKEKQYERKGGRLTKREWQTPKKREKESTRFSRASRHPTRSGREKEKQRRQLARFSIIRIYGNSVHVTPDNFRNGLLGESFTSLARAHERGRTKT